MQKYDKMFKEESVKLAKEVGPTKASEELGIPYDTLKGWIRKYKAYGDKAYIGSGRKRVEKGKERETELEEEISRLKRANDILKGITKFEGFKAGEVFTV